MVIFLTFISYLLYELAPVSLTYFGKELLKEQNTLVNVHFVMKLAKVTISLCWLPTLAMFTFANSHHMWLILSEIECFTWMNFTTNCLMEIFVADLSILIIIELVKDILKLFISKSQSPMLQIKLEFTSFNSSTLFFV